MVISQVVKKEFVFIPQTWMHHTNVLCTFIFCTLVSQQRAVQQTLYSVRLYVTLNDHVQADPKQCPDILLPPSSFLSIQAHRKCAIHYVALFRPLWAKPQNTAQLFKVDHVVWHFYTCCNCRSLCAWWIPCFYIVKILWSCLLGPSYTTIKFCPGRSQ